MADLQEYHDALYTKRGPCCAGCDWWASYNSQCGECRKHAPVDAETRWAMLRIWGCSAPMEPGHIVTEATHVCGDFKDDFDWSLLPLAYLKRIGRG